MKDLSFDELFTTAMDCFRNDGDYDPDITSMEMLMIGDMITDMISYGWRPTINPKLIDPQGLIFNNEETEEE